MIEIKDQLGRTVRLTEPARRIVSLVPSQTELLADLGLDTEVIGITKFCIHPQHWFKTKQRVGGTKDFKTDFILELKPDLILANKEENDQLLIEKLTDQSQVYISDIFTLDDALQMIRDVGVLTGTGLRADAITSEIITAFDQYKPSGGKKALYLIWNDPVMVAGSHTFIDDMLQRGGYTNACMHDRYPVLTEIEIRDLNPDVILLSSEPFPFNERHAKRFRELVPEAEIQFVDGEMFSWYGSRLRIAPDYFKTLS